MKRLLSVLFFTIYGLACLAQSTFVKTSTSFYSRFVKLEDGGYIFHAGDVCDAQGLNDFGICKTDENLNPLWNASYAVPYSMSVVNIVATTDGGYAIAGSYKSAFSWRDAFICKVDSQGYVEWMRAFDSEEDDFPYDLITTPDGSLLLAGHSTDIQGNPFLVKIDLAGNIIWSKLYAGIASSRGSRVHISENNNYILVGGMSVATNSDAVLALEVSPNGNFLSGKIYRGPGHLRVIDTTPTDDNGFIVTGLTELAGSTEDDVFGMKLDANGTVEWCRLYSKLGDDEVNEVIQAPDGGYVYAGVSESQTVGADNEMQIIRTDSLGGLMWAKEYGGPNSQGAARVEVDSSGYMLITGGNSNYYGHGFMYKVDQYGNAPCEQTVSLVRDTTLSITRWSRNFTESSPFVAYDFEVDEAHCVGNPNNLLCQFNPSSLSADVTSSNVSCNGLGNGSASAIASDGVPPYTYEWNTNPPQSSPSVYNLAAGQYICVVTDSTGTQIIHTVHIEEPPAFPVGIQSTINQNLCIGDSAVLTTDYASHWSYQWFRDGVSLGNSDTTSIAAYTSGDYTVLITDTITNCSIITDTVNVQVFDPQVEIIEYPAQNLFAASVAAPSYQWYLNGEPITGATNPFYTPTISGNYQVIITDSNGCEAESLVLEYTLQVGIEESSFQNQVRVLPNPTNGLVTIDINDNLLFEDRLNYVLVDLSGREVRKGPIVQSQTGLDLTGEANGNYILSVFVGERREEWQIIKQ